jgi:hypothetical protein
MKLMRSTVVGRTPGDDVMDRLQTRSGRGVFGCTTFIPEIREEEERLTRNDHHHVPAEQFRKEDRRIGKSPYDRRGNNVVDNRELPIHIPQRFTALEDLVDPNPDNFEFPDEDRRRLLAELREANEYRRSPEFQALLARTAAVREAMLYRRMVAEQTIQARNNASN